MTDKTRDAFEAEILKNKSAFQIKRVANGEYQSGSTREIWGYWQAATKAERERCAKVCESLHYTDTSTAQNCADAIRQGGDA